MKKMRKQSAATFGRIAQSFVATREKVKRAVWSPLILATIVVVSVGAAVVDSAATTTARQAGLVLIGAGVVGGLVTWSMIIGEGLRRRRDLQMQINTGNPLDSCDFSAAQLQGSYLRNRQMNSIRLAHADLRRADFTGTIMADAVLTRSDARNARFDGVDGFDLHGFRADFRGAGFLKSSLREAHFEEADLRNARFVEADLTGADLRKADLRGADLSSATVTAVKFEGAVYDADTLWPVIMRGEFAREARGLVEVSARRLPIIRPHQQTQLVLGAAALCATVLIGGIALTLDSGPATPATQVSPSAEVLGSSQERGSLIVTGDGLAQISVDDGVGIPTSVDAWLPYRTPIDVSDDAQVIQVAVVRRIGTGDITCGVMIDGESIASAAGTGEDASIVCTNVIGG